STRQKLRRRSPLKRITLNEECAGCCISCGGPHHPASCFPCLAFITAKGKIRPRQSIFLERRESMDFRNVSQFRLPILSAIFVLIVLGATGLWAQTTDVNYKGFTAYEEARASTGDSGQFVVLDTNIGYDFNKHVGMDVGIPVYFVRPTLPGQTQQWHDGLGDPD